MSQQHLDGAQVGTGLMSGKAAAQVVEMDVLVFKAGAFGGLLTGDPEGHKWAYNARQDPALAWSRPMQPHCVKFGVTPCMRIECKFWIEDDGWNATIESLGLTVRAPSFEAAKNDMELTLGKHIESLLGQRIPVDRGHAA